MRSNSSQTEQSHKEPDEEKSLQQIQMEGGQCLQTLMRKIDELFSELGTNQNLRPCFVERMLDFYWQVEMNEYF